MWPHICRRRIDLTTPHLVYDLECATARDRCLQIENLVQDRPEAIDVRPRIHSFNFPACLFRRHIGRRAEHTPLHRAPFCTVTACGPGQDLLGVTSESRLLAQSPIHDQDLAEVTDHHVLRFEIAVVHPAAVGEGDGIAHLLKNRKEERQWVFL